jgi:hypothetical protein
MQRRDAKLKGDGMSPDFVRKSVDRKPFQPFVVHLAGGKSIPVLSPEFIE